MGRELERRPRDPLSLLRDVERLDWVFGDRSAMFTELVVPRSDRLENDAEVVLLASDKIRTPVDGSIAPRVIVDVFDQAQYVEDPFVAEYLAGVLAGAKSPGGKDDRAVSWSSLIRRLSADQLCLHYFLYRGLRDRVVGSGQEFVDWTGTAIVVDYARVFDALGWLRPPGDRWGATFGTRTWSEKDLYRLYEAGYGLEREGLIEDFTHGGGDFFRDSVYRTRGRSFDEDAGYIGFDFSTHGIGLFLRGAGYSDEWFSSLADPALDFDLKSPELASVRGIPIRFATEYPKIQ